PVSAPCQRRDGSYLGRLRAPEGLRYWAIFDHVEGECVMDEVQSGLFGRAVAQIHLASNSFTSSHKRFTADLDWIVGDSIARLQGFLGQQHPALVEETARIAAGARAQIAALDFDDDAFGVIGGDFHGSNQHFTKDNRLGLFDFDLCSYGWRAYDIAVFRWSRGRSAELWQGFLRGYESLRPLSEV